MDSAPIRLRVKEYDLRVIQQPQAIFINGVPSSQMNNHDLRQVLIAMASLIEEAGVANPPYRLLPKLGTDPLGMLQEVIDSAEDGDTYDALVKIKACLQPSYSTIQDWVHTIPRMQQAVLLSALRGPDGVRKESGAKFLVRWFRRCCLITAFDSRVFTDMHELGGGDYTGPVPEDVNPAKAFFRCMDELPWHFVTHFVWAAEVLAYNHPVDKIAEYWLSFYAAWCKKTHVHMETREEMYYRLGDKKLEE